MQMFTTSVAETYTELRQTDGQTNVHINTFWNKYSEKIEQNFRIYCCCCCSLSSSDTLVICCELHMCRRRHCRRSFSQIYTVCSRYIFIKSQIVVVVAGFCKLFGGPLCDPCRASTPPNEHPSLAHSQNVRQWKSN